MPTRSPSANWCALRDSSNIKTAIAHRIKTRELTLSKLGDLSKVDTYRISRYLNGRKPNITQYQLFKVCEVLGIEIDVKIKFV